MKLKEYGKKFYVDKDGPPPDGVVVIVQYSGYWDGNGGITDLYWYKDDWFNYPKDKGVKIDWWMWIPED